MRPIRNFRFLALRAQPTVASLHGFSLIELMVVVVIVAILATIAIPSYTSMIKSNRMVSNVNAMVATLNLARSEAIKRGASVSVCPSSNQTACTGATSWAVGWIIFVDTDADGVRDAGEEIMRVHEALHSSVTFTTASVTSFRFRATASTTGDTFTLCDDRTGETGRQLVVGATGRGQVSDFVCT